MSVDAAGWSLARLVLVASSAIGIALPACSAGSGNTTGGGGSAGGAGGGAAAGNCVGYCATEATLKCANSTPAGCTSGCEGAKTAVSWCAPTVGAATDCLAAQ